MAQKAKRLLKEEFLDHWRNMKRKRRLKVRPVPYKHTGSTYDQDGIRITGSRDFVDAILSRLTELLDYEGDETRLQVNYSQATDRDGRPIKDAWACYVQVHERGGEAKIANALVASIKARSK